MVVVNVHGTDIRVVLLKEGGDQWSAQGLEYDICGQGKTLDEALESFEHSATGHAILNTENGNEPFYGIPRAPERYWKLRD